MRSYEWHNQSEKYRFDIRETTMISSKMDAVKRWGNTVLQHFVLVNEKIVQTCMVNKGIVCYTQGE